MPLAFVTSRNRGLVAVWATCFRADFAALWGSGWSPGDRDTTPSTRIRVINFGASAREEFITGCGQWPYLRLAAGSFSTHRSAATLLALLPYGLTSPASAPGSNAG